MLIKYFLNDNLRHFTPLYVLQRGMVRFLRFLYACYPFANIECPISDGYYRAHIRFKKCNQLPRHAVWRKTICEPRAVDNAINAERRTRRRRAGERKREDGSLHFTAYQRTDTRRRVIEKNEKLSVISSIA